jgi:hypothetical protein
MNPEGVSKGAPLVYSNALPGWRHRLLTDDARAPHFPDFARSHP